MDYPISSTIKSRSAQAKIPPITIMLATEIIFLVEQDPEGGYTAQALEHSIFTEAEDLATLKIMVKDAVHCHFDTSADRPKIIRLHIVRDEVFAV
jgi:hypothetical protein